MGWGRWHSEPRWASTADTEIIVGWAGSPLCALWTCVRLTSVAKRDLHVDMQNDNCVSETECSGWAAFLQSYVLAHRQASIWDVHIHTYWLTESGRHLLGTNKEANRAVHYYYNQGTYKLAQNDPDKQSLLLLQSSASYRTSHAISLGKIVIPMHQKYKLKVKDR